MLLMGKSDSFLTNQSITSMNSHDGHKKHSDLDNESGKQSRLGNSYVGQDKVASDQPNLSLKKSWRAGRH